jgi:hypothetical protein
MMSSKQRENKRPAVEVESRFGNGQQEGRALESCRLEGSGNQHIRVNDQTERRSAELFFSEKNYSALRLQMRVRGPAGNNTRSADKPLGATGASVRESGTGMIHWFSVKKRSEKIAPQSGDPCGMGPYRTPADRGGIAQTHRYADVAFLCGFSSRAHKHLNAERIGEESRRKPNCAYLPTGTTSGLHAERVGMISLG